MTDDLAAVRIAADKFRAALGIEDRTPAFTYLLAETSAAAAAIDANHASLGGAPGAPRGPVQAGGGAGLGFFREYEHGAIFWRRDLGAQRVYGAIYERYRALGAAGGLLGYPRTDETSTPDAVGRFNDFEWGSIYWHPGTGAHEVHGDILATWRAYGSEVFGYPTVDETREVDGRGRCSHFRRFEANGTAADVTIAWTPETGAHALVGAIRERWIALGGSAAYVGYPVTDEGSWSDPETGGTGRISHFERGAIGWLSDGGQVVELPHRVILQSGPLAASWVDGWAELILTSAGTWTYRGHLHNSGPIALSCTIASGLRFDDGAQALAVKMQDLQTGGTTSFDSRDEDWEDGGYDPRIRESWDRLTSRTTMVTAMDVALGAESFFTLIFLPLIAAGFVWTLVGGGAPPEGQHCETTGWHTVKDGNNNTIAEPGGVRCFPGQR